MKFFKPKRKKSKKNLERLNYAKKEALDCIISIQKRTLPIIPLRSSSLLPEVPERSSSLLNF